MRNCSGVWLNLIRLMFGGFPLMVRRCSSFNFGTGNWAHTLVIVILQIIKPRIWGQFLFIFPWQRVIDFPWIPFPNLSTI
jgi:hypothetical protein